MNKLLEINYSYTPRYVKFLEDVKKKRIKKFAFPGKRCQKAGMLYETSKETLYSLKYGGIITNSLDSEFIAAVKKKFKEHCMENGLKIFQIRSHPIHDTIALGKVIKKEPFAIIDLRRDESFIMKAITKSHIKSIRKADKEGLEYFETKDESYLEQFYELYKAQMQESGVRCESYTHFKDTFKHLGQDLKFACVNSDGRLIAVSIILDYNKELYLMYGGMSKEGYQKCAKHFMIYELIKEYKEKGYSHIILGTGNKGKDKIYEFKRGFTDKDSWVYTYGGEI